MLEYLNKLTDEKYNKNLYNLFLAKKSRNKELIQYIVNKNKNRDLLIEEKIDSVLTYDQHIDDDLNYLIFNNFKKHIKLQNYIKKLRIYKKFDLLEKIVTENIEKIKNIESDDTFFVKDNLINIYYDKRSINYYKLLKDNHLINEDSIEKILFKLSDMKDTDNIVLFIKELHVDKNNGYIKHLFDYLYHLNSIDEYKKIEDFHDGSYEYCLHVYARTYLKNKSSKIFQYAITKEKKENLEKLLEENQSSDKQINSNFEKIIFNEILKQGNLIKKIKI